jgi:hypothetical protein
VTKIKELWSHLWQVTPLFSLQLNMEKFGCKLDRSHASSLGWNLFTFNITSIKSGKVLFQFVHFADQTICSPYSVTRPKPNYTNFLMNMAIEIQHMCCLSSRRKVEGRECGTFIKGVIPTHWLHFLLQHVRSMVVWTITTLHLEESGGFFKVGKV